jgi:hypothetical protein
LEAMSKLKYAETPATDYHDASVQPDLIAPEDMLDQVLAALIHDGSGNGWRK